MKRSGWKKPAGFKDKTGFSNKNRGLSSKNNEKKNRTRSKAKARVRKNRRKDPRWSEIIKCDRVFSRVVRLIGADGRGECECFTCNFRGPWKHGGIECGHYKSRSNYATRWHLDNARPQCTKCNQVLGGNLKKFRKRLIQDLGEEIVVYVEGRSKKVVKLNVEDIRGIRLKFEKMERKIRKKKGL